MHPKVLVLIPAHAPDPEGFVGAQLERFRATGGTPQAWPHWDYWVFGGKWDGQILPESAPRTIPLTYRNNRCPVRELDDTLSFGALLTPDGTLHDRVERALLLAHADHVAALVDAHS